MQVDYVKSLSKSIVINIASYTSSIYLLLSWPCPGSYNSARWPGLLKIIFALAFNERYSVIMPFFFGKLNYWKHGIPLQYSCLENPMDGGAWQASVHGVAKNQTRLSDFTFTFHFHALEEEMATHSSGLAWRILGTGEPGGLLSMGSHRVRHDWSDLAAASSFSLASGGLSWYEQCWHLLFIEF